MRDEYEPASRRNLALALLVIAGWIAGFYGLMRINGGHFHGSDADVVYIVWTTLYFGAVWMFTRD